MTTKNGKILSPFNEEIISGTNYVQLIVDSLFVWFIKKVLIAEFQIKTW